jgi:hypothetical protein
MPVTRTLVLLAAVALPSLVMAQQQTRPPANPTPSELTAETINGKPYEGPEQPAPRGLDGKPDLSGYWKPLREKGKPGGNIGKDYPNFEPPYTETGLRARLYAQNHTPDPEAWCVLGGIPRHNASGLPFEILHTPGRIATLYAYNTSRRASIGPDLKFPARLEPTYFGTAIAHWEGETLVIQTRGLKDSSKDRIWIDENGDPTSDETTVVERWSRPDFHHLKLTMTVNDPKYYREPIVFNRTWVAGGATEGANEQACNENNLDAEHIGPGAGVIGPDGTRGFGYTDPLPAVPPGPEKYGR